MAISLANLCYLRSWAELRVIHAIPASYFARGPAGPTLGLTTLASVALLTGVLLVILQLIRRLPGRAAASVADLFVCGALFWVAVKSGSSSITLAASGPPAFGMVPLLGVGGFLACFSAVLFITEFILTIAY